MPHFDSRKFKVARTELGFSQKSMAIALNTSQRSVCFWEIEKSVPQTRKLKEMALYFALQFDVYRAHRITGLDIDTIKGMLSDGTASFENIPTKVHKKVAASKKIIIVTYESGVQRWFPFSLPTLEKIVVDHTFIDDLEIVEEGGEL